MSQKDERWLSLQHRILAGLRQAESVEPEPEQEQIEILPVPDVLPAPFEWCEISAGQVRLEEGGYLNEATTFEVEAFRMAKYPVTNAQYRTFVEAGGYRQDKFWTEAGIEVRDKEKWNEPCFWQDAKWNGDELPCGGCILV